MKQCVPVSVLFNRNFLASSLALASLAGPGSHALAQEASVAQLEEVVVTARRRAENLQDVPISVTAMSAEALERRQIFSTVDLDRATPSMQFTSYGQLSGNNAAAVVFIRGVGQLDPTPAVDPGVGFYIDDVYMGRSVGAAMDFLDVADVQVLRGPQGTLFGRNTIGGAVIVNSRLPGTEFGGTISAELGDDNLYQVYGVVDLPVNEDLGLRLSAGTRKRDGYVTREFDGQDLGNENGYTLKGTLRWTPSDSLDVILRADYTEKDEHGSPFVFKGINTNAPVPAIVSVAAGCPGATMPFAPLEPGDPRFGAPFVPDTDDPRCANNHYDKGPYTNGGTAPVESTFEGYGSSGTLAWQLNDALELRSITAYRETDWTGIRDADNTPFTLITTDYTSTSEQFSQELRLSFTSDRVHGITGLYYFDEDTSDRVTVPLAFPPAPPFIASLLNGGPGTRDLQFVDLGTESTAVFTEWTYDVTDALSLTGGLRYTDEDKFMQGVIFNLFPATDPDPDPLPNAAIPDGGPLFIRPDEYTENFQKMTGSASLTYNWTPTVMTYLSYADSFKSGGFNQRYNSPTPDFNPVTFDEETVESYELGIKANIGDSLRFNAAVFSSSYSDIQLIYRQGVVPLLFNAGSASIDGFELEFTYAPNLSLIVDGGFSYLDDSIDDIIEIPGADATVGPDNSLPFTPEWQGNLGVGYSFTYGDDLELMPRVDVAYTDSQFFDAANTELTAQNDSVTTVNASVTLSAPGTGWRVTLRGDNLTDELYPVQGNASLATLGYGEIVYARQRNWTLSAAYDF
ncbi:MULTISPECIES: TonB-dependent receptor domain-containing protein [unclassified Microbulbifer]|uniref:TonB-dependent receptor n=1 Tax=unclassified Microbulbifer TaxID=2619833 RepID=UPI0027E5B39F|nr:MULTISPECIES: TonB-dependent receptor [unclassified Microbulbifer]